VHITAVARFQTAARRAQNAFAAMDDESEEKQIVVRIFAYAGKAIIQIEDTGRLT
jgi:hypothetical protein